LARDYYIYIYAFSAGTEEITPIYNEKFKI
jgi:hypothetical protein